MNGTSLKVFVAGSASQPTVSLGFVAQLERYYEMLLVAITNLLHCLVVSILSVHSHVVVW